MTGFTGRWTVAVHVMCVSLLGNVGSVAFAYLLYSHNKFRCSLQRTLSSQPSMKSADKDVSCLLLLCPSSYDSPYSGLLLPCLLSASHKQCKRKISLFCCRIHYGFVRWGVCKQSRWRHSVPHTRWRICVTMATLWQQEDGCYMLLWKRHGNNKMAAMRYYGDVILMT